MKTWQRLLSNAIFVVIVISVTSAFAGSDTYQQRTIVFFGDSLTAGLGVDAEETYPALIEQRIREEKLPFRVVNAGVSGETTAGGVRRVDWVLRGPVDCFVLELGANDGLRGLNLAEMRKNLKEIIRKVREKSPGAAILLVEMDMPVNLGPEYRAEFRGSFARVAKEESIALIPFMLEGVAGNPELNAEDGIHPNAAGYRVIAENVWRGILPHVTPGSEKTL